MGGRLVRGLLLLLLSLQPMRHLLCMAAGGGLGSIGSPCRGRP